MKNFFFQSWSELRKNGFGQLLGGIFFGAQEVDTAGSATGYNLKILVYHCSKGIERHSPIY